MLMYINLAEMQSAPSATNTRTVFFIVGLSQWC